MAAVNIKELLGKLDDLEQAFQVGRAAVPFIGELVQFVYEITPLLGEVNSSLQDSAVKIPHATSRLQSVSEATELATNEILNLVDGVLEVIGGLEQRLSTRVAYEEAQAEADARLWALIQRPLTHDHPDLWPQVTQILMEKVTRRQSLRELQADERSTLDAVRKNVNHIMLALQVQDITAQQIAAVSHVIGSIEERMVRLSTKLRESHLPIDAEEVKPQTVEGIFADTGAVTFDPFAQFHHNADRQNAIDALFTHSGDSGSGPAGTLDIDALFASAAAAPPPKPASAPSAAPPPAPSSGTPAGDFDINALFASAAPPPPAPASGPASQDDIDKLFG